MCSFAAARDTIGTQEILKFAPKTEGREMPHYVVEIQPDGRPALRLVLEDEPGWLPIPEEVVVDPASGRPLRVTRHAFASRSYG